MGVLDRARQGAKAITMRFLGGAGAAWALVVGRGKIDYAREVPDLLASSIVAATLGWIARNFPEAPMRVREYDREGEPQATTDPGALRMLQVIRRPNPYFSGVLLWMATLMDFWAHGNAVWLKVRGGPGGAITELWWVPWSTISPKWPEDGSVYVSHYEYKPDPNRSGIRIEVEDVVHFRFGIDGSNIRIGRGPLKPVLAEVFTDQEAAAFTNTLLLNMGVPGLIIAPGESDAVIDQGNADSIKRKATEAFGGRNRGSTMVLSHKVTAQAFGFSPEQMNLKDLRRVPEERVSAVTGVPAIVAGLGAGLDRSTFSNFEEARGAAWEENIIPTQRLLAEEVWVQLLPEFVGDPETFLVDFDTTEVRVLQEDQNRLWERAGNALGRGAITLATFNGIVGLPVAKDGSDRVYLRPFNVVEVPEDPADRETEEEEPEEEGTPPGDPEAEEPEVPEDDRQQDGSAGRNGSGGSDDARATRTVAQARS